MSNDRITTATSSRRKSTPTYTPRTPTYATRRRFEDGKLRTYKPSSEGKHGRARSLCPRSFMSDDGDADDGNVATIDCYPQAKRLGTSPEQPLPENETNVSAANERR